ncbi:MAG: hypothetical protein ACTSW3_00605 [Promethearchaeota archaeon]
MVYEHFDKRVEGNLALKPSRGDNQFALDPAKGIWWSDKKRIKKIERLIKILKKKEKEVSADENLYKKVDELKIIYEDLLNYYHFHDSKFVKDLRKRLPKLDIDSINQRSQEVTSLVEQLEHMHSKLSPKHRDKKGVLALRDEVRSIIKEYGDKPIDSIDDDEIKWLITKYNSVIEHKLGFPKSIIIIPFNNDIKKREITLCKKVIQKYIINLFNLNLEKIEINNKWRKLYTIEKLLEISIGIDHFIYKVQKDSKGRDITIFNQSLTDRMSASREKYSLKKDRSYCFLGDFDQSSRSKRAIGLSYLPITEGEGISGFTIITNRGLYKGRYDDNGNFDSLTKEKRKLLFKEVCIHECMHYIFNLYDADIGNELRKKVHIDQDCLGLSKMKINKNFYFCDLCIKGMLASLVGMEKNGYKVFKD